MRRVIISVFILFAVCSATHSYGQNRNNDEPPLNRVLFLVDASNSMYGVWQSDRKINIARKLLSNLIDSLRGVDNVELALRVYGHQKPYPPQDCDDTKLEVPFSPANGEKIKRKLATITPRGTTPIAYSLEQCINDFPQCSNCRNIVVLITDGIEECDGDPCAVSRALQKSGVILKPFIIGIGRDFSNEFECVGTFFDASSEKSFRKALNVVISQALNSTTVQVNLLDAYGNATETNVNMTFYDHYTGQVKHNFVHTMNSRGVPDTLVIDPLTLYDVVVHTIPPVRKDSIKLIAGKHNIIAIDAPQGHLKINVGGYDNRYNEMQCILRLNDGHKTIHVQNMGSKEKYIVGTYDLEILCLPRLIVEDVEITQNHTTEVEIPNPGQATFKFPIKGFASLYQQQGNELVWLYNFDKNKTSEILLLQPGFYTVVFRSKYATRTFYTMEQSFEIIPGKGIVVQLKN